MKGVALVGVLRFVAYVRFCCWPLFLLTAYTWAMVMVDMWAIWSNLLPYETFYGKLGPLDRARLGVSVLLLVYAMYLGYRCVANEFDDNAKDLNKDLNRAIVQAIVGRRRGA